MTPAQVREEAITTPTLCARIVQLTRRQARRLLDWLETRRAQAQRRQPATVTGRLRRARTLLILCQGNVSRSVFAAHLLASRIQGERAPVIKSAGLGTQPGWRAHRRVVERCKALSIDIRSHASVAVTAEMMRAADVVFVMEVAHLVTVTRQFPTARSKTFLLTCLAPHLPMDIADPAGKPDEVVDACLDHVKHALEPILDVLAARKAVT